jgi:hypothetical protein
MQWNGVHAAVRLGCLESEVRTPLEADAPKRYADDLTRYAIEIADLEFGIAERGIPLDAAQQVLYRNHCPRTPLSLPPPRGWQGPL